MAIKHRVKLAILPGPRITKEHEVHEYQTFRYHLISGYCQYPTCQQTKVSFDPFHLIYLQPRTAAHLDV